MQRCGRLRRGALKTRSRGQSFPLVRLAAAGLAVAALAAAPPAGGASNPTPLATPSWIHDVSLDVTKAPYAAQCGSEATPKIQKAIDDANAQGGGGVLLPCSFTVTGLTMRSNVNVYGIGASAGLVGSAGQNVVTIPDWTENVSLRNVTIQGGLNGIVSDTLSYHVIVDDVTFRGAAEAAIRVRGSIERWSVTDVRAEGGRWFYKHDFGQARDENYLDKTVFRNVTAVGQSDYAWSVEVEYSHSVTLMNATVSAPGVGALVLAGGLRGLNVFNLVTQGNSRPGPDVVVSGSPGAPGSSFQTVNFVGGSLSGASAFELDVRDPYGKVHLFGVTGWRVNAPAGNVVSFAGIPAPAPPAVPAVPQTRYDVTKPPFNAPCNSGDATAAIQSAINRASEVAAGLYIPCPIFVKSLTLRSNVHFYGRARRIDNGSQGSALVGTASADMLTLSPNSQNVSFRNLNLYSGRNTIVVKDAANVVFDLVSFSVPIEAAVRASGSASSWIFNEVNAAGGRWFWRQESGTVSNTAFVQVHAINHADRPFSFNVTGASSVGFLNPIAHFAGTAAMAFAGAFTQVHVIGIYTERVGQTQSGQDAVSFASGGKGSQTGLPDVVHLTGGMVAGYTSFTRSDVGVAAANRVNLYAPGYWGVWDPGGKATFYGGFARRL